jgi:2-phosphoglycerate kinase
VSGQRPAGKLKTIGGTSMSEAQAKYLQYLKKYAAKHQINMTEANKHMIPVTAARVYGVTEAEMEEIEKQLA